MADNLSSYDLSSSYQLPTYQQQAARAQEIGKLLFIRTDTNTRVEHRVKSGAELLVGRQLVQQLLNFHDATISANHLLFRPIVYEMNDPHANAPLLYVEDHSLNGTILKRSCVESDTLAEEEVHVVASSGPQLLNSGDVLTISDTVKIEYSCHAHENPSEGLTEIQYTETMMLQQGFYQISERKLGFGAFGSVFAAVDISTKRQVACKIIDLCSIANKVKEEIHGLRQNESDNAAYLDDYRRRMKTHTQRASQEYLLLAKLSHPNIISVHRVFRTSHNIYIFQELMSGGDLFSYLDSSKDGYLPEVNAAVIVRQVLEAVHYLHQQGIAHRDIKPENVLMTNLRAISRVVLTDFGQARRIPVEEEGSPAKKRMQTHVGTYDYAAPEITGRYRSKQESGYTEAVDLWSVGIITAMLLTGDTLFLPPDDVPAVAHAHMNSEDERRQNSEHERSEFITHFASQCKLTVTDNAANPRWKPLSSRAKSFVKQLLVLEEHRRLRAKQALDHLWFKHPTYVSELQHAYEYAIRDWKQSDEQTAACQEIDTVDIIGYSVMDTPPPDSESQQGIRSEHFPRRSAP